jgi:hypothetical protein
VNFIEPFDPLSIAANSLIREWMKVSMSAIVAASKDNAGHLSIGALMEKAMSCREPQIAKTQFGSQAYGARDIANRLLGRQHAPYNKRITGEYSTS